ncbi:TPA: hypothetical protein ACRRX0_000327 [Morganella morganii]
MPANMTVNYWLESNGSLLGTEMYQNITEVTLPLPTEDGHKITLTRYFSGNHFHRWLVERVIHNIPGQADLYLTPRTECNDEVFLAKTYASRRNIAARLTKGTLVEVEYGFIQSTKRITGKISSVKRYPDLLQNGEMHKRRLAIVVSSRLPALQVIPVTSVPQDLNNKTIFEISFKSRENLISYNEPDKAGFALGGMIQTVSLRRVLPPLTMQKGHRYRDVSYSHRLCPEDMKALEAAITTSVGYGDYQEIRRERNQLRKDIQRVNEQLSVMTEELTESHNFRAEHQQIALRCRALEEQLVDWYRSINGNLTAETAREQMETDLQLYLEFDEH